MIFEKYKAALIIVTVVLFLSTTFLWTKYDNLRDKYSVCEAQKKVLVTSVHSLQEREKLRAESQLKILKEMEGKTVALQTKMASLRAKISQNERELERLKNENAELSVALATRNDEFARVYCETVAGFGYPTGGVCEGFVPGNSSGDSSPRE